MFILVFEMRPQQAQIKLLTIRCLLELVSISGSCSPPPPQGKFPPLLKKTKRNKLLWVDGPEIPKSYALHNPPDHLVYDKTIPVCV